MPDQKPRENSRGERSRASSSRSRYAFVSDPTRHTWTFTQPAGQQQGSQSTQDTANASRAQHAHRTIAENTLNDFSDIELQEVLYRRYHQLDERGRPSMDEVRQRVATLLGLVGPRGLPARDAVILLAQAGWNATLALRQYIENIRPQIQQDIERVQNPPPENSAKAVKDPRDDGDDDLPIPAGVEILEIEHPDIPNAKAKAVYHYQIREYLIERDQRRYGNYRHKRTRGMEFEDQTAPHPNQLRWGFNKQKHMPAILFQFKKAGYVNPDYEWEYMWWRGHAVVDIDRAPLRDFRDIPSTLASNVEPGLLEAIERLDSRVRHQELSPRVFTRKIPQHPTPTEIKARDNKLSQSIRRFREQQGMITWKTSRSGSDAYLRWMEENLPPQLKALNTTRGFPQLSRRQLEEIKDTRIGQFPNRSRTRDPVVREKYLADHRAKLERLRKQDVKPLKQELAEPVDSDSESEEDYRGPDSRYNNPQNAREEAELHDAMMPTILQFLDLTGELPVIGHWQLSYLITLGEIHRQLQNALTRQGASPVEPVGYGFWTGGIMNWRTAELEASPLAKKQAEIEREEEKAARRAAKAHGSGEQEEDDEENMDMEDDDEEALSGEQDRSAMEEDSNGEDEAERSAQSDA
ncbi:MAG: hypothetical protein Q9213_003135 [Squamulea squamosa]